MVVTVVDSVVAAEEEGLVVDSIQNPVNKSWSEMCVSELLFCLLDSRVFHFTFPFSCLGRLRMRIWLSCLRQRVRWSWLKSCLTVHVQRDAVWSSLDKSRKPRQPLPNSKAMYMAVGLWVSCVPFLDSATVH